MALTDLTRISTSGIATGSTIDSPILRKDVSLRGSQVGVTSALFDSSENELNLKDNVKLTFGNATNGDLRIYHDTSNGSYVREAGPGALRIQGDAGVWIQSSSDNQDRIVTNHNGDVQLFYSGDKKLNTTNHGVEVTGVLTATSFSGPMVGNANNSSGISTFYDLRVSNNLTVEGTTTTLDTNLIGVDRIEVGANSNTVTGIAVTQSGTADLVRLYDGASQVVTVDDEGKVGLGSAIPSERLDVVGNVKVSGTSKLSGDVTINRTTGLSGSKLSINKDADEEGIGIQLNQSSGITTSITTFNSSGSQIFSLAHDTDATPDLLFKLKHSTDSAPVEKVRILSTGEVRIISSGDNDDPAHLRLHCNDSSIVAGDGIGVIRFAGRDSGGAAVSRTGALIEATAAATWDTGQSTGYSATHLDFFTQNNSGTDTVAAGRRLRITSDGDINFGVQSSSTAITSGTIKQVSLGKDYWNGDKGHYGALRLLVYDNGVNDAYGFGISNGELEIQSQGHIGIYAGSGASDSKRDRRMYIDTSGDVIFGYNTSGSVNSSDLFNMSLGGTYHDTDGTYPKLSLWHDGTDHMGFGVSANQLDYILTSTVYDHVFYGGNSGATELLRIKGDGSSIETQGLGTFEFNDGWSAEGRNVVVFPCDDTSKWFSFVGTNLRFTDGGNFVKPSDNGNSNWGNIAGIAFEGSNNGSNPAIRFVVDQPGENGQNYSLGSGNTGKTAAIDNNTAMCIAGNGRVLIGTNEERNVSTSVNAYLQLEGTTYHQSAISVTRNTDDAYGSYLILGKSRGTSNGADTVLQDNDIISEFRFAGSDGTDMKNVAAMIRVEVDGTPQTDQMPGAMIFRTNSGSTGTTEALRITSGRLVQIDTPGVTAGNGASAKLQVDSSSQYDGLLLGNAATYGTISRGANNGALVYTANAYPANLGGGEKITHEWWSGNAGGGGPDQLMVLSAGGKLGLNEASPQSILDVKSDISSHPLGAIFRKDYGGDTTDASHKVALTIWGQDHNDLDHTGQDAYGPMIGFGARNDDSVPNTGDIRAAIAYRYNGNLTFHTEAGGSVTDGSNESLRIHSDGRLTTTCSSDSVFKFNIDDSIGWWNTNTGLAPNTTRTWTITNINYGGARILIGGGDGNYQRAGAVIEVVGTMWANNKSYYHNETIKNSSGASISTTYNNNSIEISVTAGSNWWYYSMTVESHRRESGAFPTVTVS